jgi:hypothetical protein
VPHTDNIVALTEGRQIEELFVALEALYHDLLDVYHRVIELLACYVFPRYRKSPAKSVW